MHRHPHWPRLLVEAVNEKQNEDFEYGKHDCCIFTCDIVSSYTDVDLAENFRGYKGPANVARLFKKYGGDVRGIAEAVTKEYGLVENELPLTQKGDVVLVFNNGNYLLGVMYNGGRVACAAHKGVALLPFEEAVASWRVPY